MTTTTKIRARRRYGEDAAADDRLNTAFHQLLREAAEERDERQRVHQLQDDAAAKRESQALISLARRL